MDRKPYTSLSEAYMKMFEASEKPGKPPMGMPVPVPYMPLRPVNIHRTNVEIDVTQPYVGPGGVEKAYYSYPAGFDPTNREDVIKDKDYDGSKARPEAAKMTKEDVEVAEARMSGESPKKYASRMTQKYSGGKSKTYDPMKDPNFDHDKAERTRGSMQERYLELDENRRAARSAGGYKDDSKKQTDPSKAGFTGISGSIKDIMRQNKEIEARNKMSKEEVELDELYKGKHGQSDSEYADSRSPGGKMISGDSKGSGAEYTHGRRVKAANPGMQPDVGGKTKPKSQGRMDAGTRADLQYRKANLKKEDIEIVGDYLMEAGLVSSADDVDAFFTHMSDEWRDHIVERCWKGYKPTPGKKAYDKGSCQKA